MSFVMIAAGQGSRTQMRTVSTRALLAVGVVAASALLAAGTGLGYWLSSATAPAPALPDPNRSALPFALEQLGTLSGRLFKLESQAGHLSEQLGLDAEALPDTPQALPKAGPPQADSASAPRGGPMLPPRGVDAAWAGQQGVLDRMIARLEGLEEQLALVSGAAALENLAQIRMPTRLPIDDARMVSRFGNRSDPLTGRRAFHAGLDFAAEAGTDITAAAAGKVVVAGYRPDYGWLVEIDHGNGLSTRYGHASKLLVKPGALVLPGDVIALVGSTGRSTGPHLHFEVLRQGRATDPRRYLAGL